MTNKSMDVNEIVIIASQTPGQVSFHNFEELKEYINKGSYCVEKVDYPQKCY